MGTSTYQPSGQSCTTLEERKEYAKLPGLSKGYLTEKALKALKYPKVITVKRKNGSTFQSLLQQVVVSGAIRIEEYIANFYWQYKAEVSFDMTPTALGLPPKPFLSSGNLAEGAGRRHSLNPFPPGMTVGYLRRPDVIIVKDPLTRWPGLATTDHEGAAHADNLLRVVELKFPEDDLDKGQEEAYKLIAGGGVGRLCIVDVNDCDGDLEKVREGERQRAPVRSPQPIADPAFYERWLTEAEKDVQAIWDATRQGVYQLSQEAQAWLRQKAPWLFSAGRWVSDAARQTYQWVSDTGEVLATWTVAQLKAMWAAIVKATDWTWQQLKSIDWAQMLIDVVQGICVVVLCVGAGFLIAMALPAELFAGFAALMGIAAAA